MWRLARPNRRKESNLAGGPTLNDETPALPIEFNPISYSQQNPDLIGKSANELLLHWTLHGQAEGRVPNSISSRADFQSVVWKHVTSRDSSLEISPFTAPVLGHERGLVCDVVSYDELLVRAETLGFKAESVAKPDFLLDPTVGIRAANRTFRMVVSSHVLEHTPDLIFHLLDIESILIPGGRYFLFIPDKRYCFDRFLPETTIADVVEAHTSLRTQHTLKSVVEHRALTTHNEPVRHWLGDHEDEGFQSSIPGRVVDAVAEFHAARGAYIDVHSWRFTPESFRRVFCQIQELYGLALEVERVYSTRHGHNEFWAVLRRLGKSNVDHFPDTFS